MRDSYYGSIHFSLKPQTTTCRQLLKYEIIWGHIEILVVAVRSLSRSEHEGEDYHLSYFRQDHAPRVAGPCGWTAQSNHEVGPRSRVEPRLAGLKRELCSDLSRSPDAL